MGVPSCRMPFESGGELCGRCRGAPTTEGMRLCSRVVAVSSAMRSLLARASAIAASDASVVIVGETGCGKEVLARAMHATSDRRQAAFLAVNVAALPAGLLESELFGHVRGAFTGATAARRGLFDAARGGTLFLDEIAEMPLALQSKLLRALQDGEVRRVGDDAPTRVDVRILCATHQDLRQAVVERRFREDLYYRLKVFTLEVPPLRARREDILPLARIFLEQERHPTGRLTAGAEAALVAYGWPGNVRELSNAVKHAAVLSGGTALDVAHLPAEVAGGAPPPVPAGALRPLLEVEREHVLNVLRVCGGQQAQAARILGIGRTTLWRKLREYGIDAA